MSFIFFRSSHLPNYKLTPWKIKWSELSYLIFPYTCHVESSYMNKVASNFFLQVCNVTWHQKKEKKGRNEESHNPIKKSEKIQELEHKLVAIFFPSVLHHRRNFDFCRETRTHIPIFFIIIFYLQNVFLIQTQSYIYTPFPFPTISTSF